MKTEFLNELKKDSLDHELRRYTIIFNCFLLLPFFHLFYFHPSLSLLASYQKVVGKFDLVYVRRRLEKDLLPLLELLCPEAV